MGWRLGRDQVGVPKKGIAKSKLPQGQGHGAGPYRDDMSDISNTGIESLLTGVEHPFLGKGHGHDKCATRLVKKLVASWHLPTQQHLLSQAQYKRHTTTPLSI